MRRGTTQSGFLKTRVGRRTLLAFLGAAMLPATLVAGVGVSQIHAALETQAIGALHQNARSASLVVLERLLAAVERAGFSSEDAPRVTVLPAVSGEPGSARIVATVLRPSTGQRVDRTIDMSKAWQALTELFDEQSSGYCIMDVGSGQLLHCSPSLDTTTQRHISALARSGDSTSAALSAEGWLHVSRDVYLRAAYGAPSWRLVMISSADVAKAPASSTLRTLVSLLAIAMVAAFGLSHAQIRHRTEPLEALHAGTRRVRQGLFDTTVTVTADDEYGELADAFNAMTRSIGRQFSLMSHLDAMDDVALRTPGTDALVEVAIARLHRTVDTRHVAIVLLDANDTDAITLSSSVAPPAFLIRTERGFLTPVDRALLEDVGGHVTTRELPQGSAFRSPQEPPGSAVLSSDLVLLPLRQHQALVGVVALHAPVNHAFAAQHLEDVRRVVDRLAVALASVRLLEQLDALSTGTLKAFASAIDANSRWTAGHSERVTQVAVLLGRELALPEAALLQLYRGSLLHDVGKIGVPPEVLNKAGALSPDELAMMHRHPVIGVEILSAIPAFRDLLPMVRSHHERLDGRGYPDGLTGEEIPFLARVVAVADAFDAMVSDRPYRTGLSLQEAVRRIASDRGTHFDPRVVDAMIVVAQSGELKRIARAQHLTPETRDAKPTPRMKATA